MDLILHIADDWVLDTVWSYLTPATPTSSLLKRSPALLGAFLHDPQTRRALGKAAADNAGSIAREAAAQVADGAVNAAASGASGGSAAGTRGRIAGALLSNLSSTLVRAVSSSSSLSAHISAPSAQVASDAYAAAAASSISSGITDSTRLAWTEAEMNWSALSHLSALPRTNWVRQSLSLYALTYVGILVLYFAFAGLSYKFIFNKAMLRHPRFLKNQVRLEIQSSLAAFPVLDLMTLPWFLGEVRGWSKLYSNIDKGPWADKWWGLHGWSYVAFSVVFFLVFTDACIYWVHRLEHHPKLYKHIHKPHHRWLGEYRFRFS